jgi:hypothetical protein
MVRPWEEYGRRNMEGEENKRKKQPRKISFKELPPLPLLWRK